MTQGVEFDPTARLLADTLNTDLPTDVESRMRERLDALRTKMELPTVHRVERTSKPRRLFAGVTALAAACAAALLLALVLLPVGPSRALAQIVNAVGAKTWLHATGSGPDGEPAEMWFSAKEGILAFRAGESYVLVDQAQGTMDVYGKPASTESIDRKSTRLNSSHLGISYAVFCLKKKKK